MDDQSGGESGEALKRNWWPWIFACWFAWFIVPLFLVSVTRPFGWWDYLTTLAKATSDASEFGFKLQGIYTPFEYSETGAVLRNYTHHMFRDVVVLRPTLALLFHLQGLVFGGEFWLWYLLKWTAEFGAAGLSVAFLRRFHVGTEVQWMAAAFVLFHPCSFEMMLCSSDGWVALGSLATLYLAWPLELRAMSWPRYLAVTLVWFLTLGVKESALVFAVVFVLMAQWRARGLCVRLLPYYLVLALWIWRIYEVSQNRLRGHAGSDILGNLSELSRLLTPDSPLHMLAVLLPLLLIYGAWKLQGDQRILLLMLAATASGTLLMSARYMPAARYNVPVVYWLGLAVGLTVSLLPYARRLAIGAAILLPLWQASNLYSQSLAYQQLFLEYSDVLTRIQQKVADGYALAVSGDDEIPGEWQASVALFQVQFGERFYSLPKQQAPFVLKREGIPKVPFVLLTSAKADRVKLATEDVESVEVFARGGYGSLERMAARYSALNRMTGIAVRPSYDVGAPVLSDEPVFGLVFVKPGAKQSVEMTATMCEAAGGSMVSQVCKVALKGDQNLVARVSLGSWNGPRRIHVDGEIALRSGAVSIGVGDRDGHDLWNVPLTARETWQKVPEVPELNGTGKEHFLFLFSAKGARTQFELRELRLARRVERRVLVPNRRYGAVGR